MNQYYKLFVAACFAVIPFVAKAQCDTVSVNFANITSTGAIGTWTTVANAQSYSYAVLLATSPTPPAGGTITTQHTIHIQGMAPDREYKICVQTNCASGTSAWTCGSFKTLPGSTGINTVSQSEAGVYPNPVTDILHFNFADKGTHHISIVNTIGATISTHILQSGETSINLSNLQSGLYFVKSAAENNIQTFKIDKR